MPLLDEEALIGGLALRYVVLEVGHERGEGAGVAGELGHAPRDDLVVPGVDRPEGAAGLLERVGLQDPQLAEAVAGGQDVAVGDAQVLAGAAVAADVVGLVVAIVGGPVSRSGRCPCRR
jgi:hypothetical protein